MRKDATGWKGRGWRGLLCAAVFLPGGLSALAGYPFSAEIENVSGRWTGSRAEVVWTTGSEVGTAGFRIFRVEADGEVPLHEGYLPVDITQPYGAVYAVADPSQSNESTASYRLEELRGDGSRMDAGTWTVQFRRPAPARAVAAAMVTGAGVAASEPATGPAVKVWISSNDIYFVTFASIAAGLGLTESDVAGRASQSLLAMRCGDEPVAYGVDTNLQRIVFYGWAATNRYTHKNAFWIEPGPGQHMLRVAPEAIAPITNQTFYGFTDVEMDLISMIDHRPVLRDDLYVWTHIVSGDATHGARTFAVPMDGYASNDVTITVRLIGYYDTPADPDHLVEFRFNNQLLSSVTFDGKAEISAMFTVPASLVLVSGNQLNVKGILQTNVTASTLVMDGFEVGYRQFYAPRESLLRASNGGNARLSAALFADPIVLNVTDPRQPVWIADEAGALPGGTSWPSGAGTDWALRERALVPQATPLPAGFGAWMKQTTNAVDYLVIAPRAFEVPARALADYRAGLGLRSAVALYEDVCDQFAGGLNTPEAIRTGLTYAHQQWAAAPWMVVLGGWGHYDYLGTITTATNYLPALLGSDSYYLRPADGLLADVTGDDGVPDLAIGRLPVQSVAQFDAYLAKLQAYEAAGPQAWQGRIVFAADNADAAGDFTATNQDMASEAGKRATVEFTSLDSSPVAAVKTALRASFTNGSGMVHYTGHGSYRQLAGESLLHYTDIASLMNPPVPLFASMTCLIGRFDIYLASQRCLAEAIVLQPEGGALAVYSPSGLSYNYFAALFGKEFHRIHAVEHADAIGPALLRARRSFGALGGLHADSIRTYNLLGDPAVKLRGGEGGPPPEWIPTYAQWRWERLSYADLAVSGSDGDLFPEYVSGGLPPGLGSGAVENETGKATVRWNQRKLATDLEYRLMVSTNLLGNWEPAPPEVARARTGQSSGVVEEMEAKFPFAFSPFFIKLDAVRR